MTTSNLINITEWLSKEDWEIVEDRLYDEICFSSADMYNDCNAVIRLGRVAMLCESAKYSAKNQPSMVSGYDAMLIKEFLIDILAERKNLWKSNYAIDYGVSVDDTTAKMLDEYDDVYQSYWAIQELGRIIEDLMDTVISCQIKAE